jgi:hypothetical protein
LEVSAAVVVVAAVCFAFLALLVFSLGQLSGDRRSVAVRYIALAVFAIRVLLDWLSGATDWVMVEGSALMVAIPMAIGHLWIMLRQESRESRGFRV